MTEINHTRSDCLKDVVKWLGQKCKEQKNAVSVAENGECNMGCFDCWESFHEVTVAEKAKLNTLVEIKVGVEKYMKKIRHEENGE